MPAEFGELPRNGQNKYDWPEIIRDLRGNPGEWAKIEGINVAKTVDAAQATARNLRKGSPFIANVRRGEFDATVRGTDVWARYVGD